MSRAREYYATPGRHTDVGAYAPPIASVSRAVEVVQGLLVYDAMAEALYDTILPEAQAAAFLLRDAAAMLELVHDIDARPLVEPRPPGRRIGARCNTYTLLTVALLRAAGVPARSRCGFATYFNPGWYEDHWVVEYWDTDSSRWRLLDAQLDEVWRPLTTIDGTGPAHVDESQFLTAGHAWQAWRRGEIDADRCGLTSIPEHGAFWIAGNLRLDFAALNKVEMSPWDLWGLFWEPHDTPPDGAFTALDEVAALTTAVDDRFDDVRRRYDSDERFRMDGAVFSVARGDFETV